MTTTIEIDRANATIERSDGFAFWKKRRRWHLRLFDTVRLLPQTTLVEEGYGITRYSLFLEGPGISQELFSTDEEQLARSLYNEISEYLQSRNRT
jgi:hypothetical protein